MSTVIPILMEAERLSFLEDVLRRQQPGSRAANSARRQGRDARPGTPYGASYGNARDTDMGRPEVRAVGRSSGPANPIRSAKSKIVPEPDQVQSGRPSSRTVTGPLEPRG